MSPLTPLAIELTKLIGSKELSFGCLVKSKKWELDLNNRRICASEYVKDNEDYEIMICYFTYNGTIKKIWWWDDFEIIWHPATLSDLHRWMNEQNVQFAMYWEMTGYMRNCISLTPCIWPYQKIPYDSSKGLLEQETSTLEQIISLIKS